MNGGTLRSAMSNPLINPGITAMANPAKTAMIRLSSGLLNVVPQLKTWAVTTADRPIVNPTDKSMPPEIITNVWPRASSSGVTVNSAIDFTLNGLNKNVVLYAARAHISNVTRRIAKNSQARNVARKSSQLACFCSVGATAADVTMLIPDNIYWFQITRIWWRPGSRHQISLIVNRTSRNR